MYNEFYFMKCVGNEQCLNLKVLKKIYKLSVEEIWNFIK